MQTKRSMNKILSTLTLSIAFCITLQAQDPHFSQFYNAPLQMNPAYAGVFQGSWRAGVNYRSQWASVLESNPYRTVAANYDAKIQVSRDDNMGVSFSMLNDQAGPSNFSQFKGHLGASYQKKVNGGGRNRRSQNDQYIVAGFQIGAGQFRVNTNNLWFTSQYDEKRVSVDLNAASGETFGEATSNIYADLNAGLLWYMIFDDNKSVYVGGSINHANAPNIRFNGSSSEADILRWRFVGQVGAELPFTEQLSILPAFVVQTQGVSQQFMTGANLRYNARDWREVALRTGLWTRIANNKEKGKFADAIIITSILEMEKLNIGLSYDINISNLNVATNYRGAFEVSIQYVQPPARRKGKVVCPRF